MSLRIFSISSQQIPNKTTPLTQWYTHCFPMKSAPLPQYYKHVWMSLGGCLSLNTLIGFSHNLRSMSEEYFLECFSLAEYAAAFMLFVLVVISILLPGDRYPCF